jgi:hypothetical protein
MARYEVRAGEEVVLERRVQTPVNGTQRPAKLILTNQRLVVIADEKQSWFQSVVLGRAAKLVAAMGGKITHQLERADFSVAEQLAPGHLEVRSTGEGYGMIHFDLYELDCAEWLAALERWKRGG